jgi:Phosphotransferase system mannitol/fructose-specific IIA domain (Ntr-type)
MFKIFRKNHTTANVELQDNNQLGALKYAAQKVADEFKVDGQNVQSSIFASAAQGNTILEDRVVFTYATSSDKSKIHTMTLTFKDPIIWGNDNKSIDYLIVALLPSDTTDDKLHSLTDDITTKIHNEASHLDDIKFNDNLLNN